MDLAIYNIIEKLVITDKAAALAREHNKMTFQVHPKANKPMIKEAIEKLFSVKVETIRTKTRKGKIKTFRRIKTQGSLQKCAIVTLKPGYSFDMAAQGGVAAETVQAEKQG